MTINSTTENLTSSPSININKKSTRQSDRSSVLFSNGGHFIDRQSNQLINLRGVSLSGHSKLPSKPDGRTHLAHQFFEHRDISFVDHPIKLIDAHHYLSELASLGFNLIRLVICWEAIEHSAPGVYDHQYLDYISSFVRICQEDYQFKILIDAHQDVWSRFSGGSGAPGWTLELVGFEIPNLSDSYAASLHQLGAPKGSWPSGYQKLAAGTMFTIFFAGDKFAPNRKVQRKLHHVWKKDENRDELITLQEFLQASMIEAFGKLADVLSGFECVIGFEPINEPHRGFINLHSPYKWNSMTDLLLYDSPSFIQAVALGEGYPQRIDVYTPTWPLPSMRFRTRVVRPKVRAWQSSVECIWKEHGVWKWDERQEKPIVLQPNYFNVDPDSGKPYEFYGQSLFPFTCRFAKRVQTNRPDWFISVGPIPNEFYPKWDPQLRPPNLVAGPHFYDLFSLCHKSHGSVTLDVQGICMKEPFWRCVYFGKAAAKRNYSEQIRRILDSVRSNIGEVPCLIGEFGICMDLNKGEAFKSQNFYWQHHQMDALLYALEVNLVPFVLWNYNPYNTDEHGDGWNGENFSFISQSASSDSSSYSQARILSAVKRPYAHKIAGIPTGSTYDSETSKFRFEYRNPNSAEENKRYAFAATKTEVFLPIERFPADKVEISVSDGTYEHDPSKQSLIWSHSNLDPGAIHVIEVSSPVRFKLEKPPPRLLPISWCSLFIILSVAIGVLSVFLVPATLGNIRLSE